METLRGDGKRFDALITVLNVGFERSGVVTRLEHRGNRYVEEPHEVFAPRVLACLASVGAIAAAYDRAPARLEGEGLDDRAVDLWSPLVALTIVADQEDRGHRARALLEAARQLGALRDAELLTEVSQRPGWERVKTPRALAMLLNPLGIVRRQLWNRGQRQWAYVLNRKQLADLAARYASPDTAEPEASGADVVEPSVKNGSAPRHAPNGHHGLPALPIGYKRSVTAAVDRANVHHCRHRPPHGT